MTMPRGASRALYAGNGQAVEFPFLFKVFEEDQLSVLLTSPAGVTTEAAGWTAELDDGGGTVRYLHNGAPLPEGWKLAIMRDMPFVQEVDLITGTRFDPEVIETALDVATAERQQLLERLARAVVVEPTDEAGPEALLADIRDARTSAAASATSAQANANAAAESARAAAGSAAVATEQREAACICAGEAKDARDVALAQAEAANTLMEAELAKVNAIVAANRTDQEAAVTAARQWAEKEADVPVEYDEEGNPRYSARHWAENAQKIAIEPPTAERRGAIRVGAGLHLTAGENGETDVLALDGVEEQWITESGDFTVPLSGWYEVFIIDGGQGGGADIRTSDIRVIAKGGDSGAYKKHFIYLEKGTVVPVVIGAGGLARQGDNGGRGGGTSFGELTSDPTTRFLGTSTFRYTTWPTSAFYIGVPGAGPGGGSGGYAATMPNAGGYVYSSAADAIWYGGGGGAYLHSNGGKPFACAGNGAPGVVRLRWRNPDKVPSPLVTPALFAARRVAAPQADGPVTVNLYALETGQGSVWREEAAEVRLAEGLVTQETWQEICAAKAAEEYAAWLASPETEAERFELLRAARDAKLAATDYLVAPDYPLTEEQRAEVTAWRQALRDLPAQESAPWDGGGEATPWPELPGAASGALPCA